MGWICGIYRVQPQSKQVSKQTTCNLYGTFADIIMLDTTVTAIPLADARTAMLAFASSVQWLEKEKLEIENTRRQFTEHELVYTRVGSDQRGVADQTQAQAQATVQVVRLNVGGEHVSVSHGTLTKHPHSMLAAMFSGRYTNPTDSEGRVFLDRDYKQFQFVLHFLRTGTLPRLPDDPVALDLVRQEFDFFMLQREFASRTTLALRMAEPRTALIDFGRDLYYKDPTHVTISDSHVAIVFDYREIAAWNLHTRERVIATSLNEAEIAVFGLELHGAELVVKCRKWDMSGEGAPQGPNPEVHLLFWNLELGTMNFSSMGLLSCTRQIRFTRTHAVAIDADGVSVWKRTYLPRQSLVLQYKRAISPPAPFPAAVPPCMALVEVTDTHFMVCQTSNDDMDDGEDDVMGVGVYSLETGDMVADWAVPDNATVLGGDGVHVTCVCPSGYATKDMMDPSAGLVETGVPYMSHTTQDSEAVFAHGTHIEHACTTQLDDCGVRLVDMHTGAKVQLHRFPCALVATDGSRIVSVPTVQGADDMAQWAQDAWMNKSDFTTVSNTLDRLRTEVLHPRCFFVSY